MPHVSRKKLEMMISGIPGFKAPKERLEQYVTPADIAAEMVWDAFMFGDVEGRVVHDLGCGTGRLALAASTLNARYVVCSDIDPEALEIAEEVLKAMSPAPYDVVLTDLREAPPFRACDCVVIMNPPFGVKSRGADMDFLKTSLSVCNTVYSIHKFSEGIHETLRKLSEAEGFNYETLKEFRFPLRASLAKHRRKVLRVDALLIRASKSNVFKSSERSYS